MRGRGGSERVGEVEDSWEGDNERGRNQMVDRDGKEVKGTGNGERERESGASWRKGRGEGACRR